MFPILMIMGLMVVSLALFLVVIVFRTAQWREMAEHHDEFRLISTQALQFVRDSLDEAKVNGKGFKKVEEKEKWFDHYFGDNYEETCAVFASTGGDLDVVLDGAVSDEFMKWHEGKGLTS